MIVKCLRPGDAKRLLEARIAGQTVSVTEATYESGLGRPLEENAISTAVEALKALRHAYPNQPNVAQAASYDATACQALHESLHLDPVAAGNPDFWIWLAVERFAEVVEWRYGRNDEPANLRNYGIGGRWENLLARLWFRAELAYESGAADPYGLARRGSIDFWQSGIIRVRYGSCRPLTRAFVRLQYPDTNPEAPTFHPMDQRGVRLLYKRIKRLQATVALEYFDDEGALNLLSNLSANLARA